MLSFFKNTTSNLKKHMESQHGTVKFTEQVPLGAKRRAANAEGGPPPTPKQQKLDFGAKPVSGGGGVEGVGQTVCCRGNAAF